MSEETIAEMKTETPKIILSKEVISEIISDYLNLNRLGKSMGANNTHFVWRYDISSPGETIFETLEIEFNK